MPKKNISRRQNCLYLSPIALLGDVHCTLLFLCALFMGMGTHLINPVIPEIISNFNISELSASMVMSLFSFPAIFLSPILGSLSDKYGHKIFLIIGILIFGISGTLPAIFNLNYNYLLITRFIQGIGFAISMPLTIAVIGDFHKGSQEVAAQGMRSFFMAAGGFLFPILGGTLALIRWNLPFFPFIFTIPFAFILWRFLPNPTFQENKKKVNLKYYINSLKKTKESTYVLLATIATLLRFFIVTGIRFYLPIFLVMEFTANLSLVGFILGLLQAGKSFSSLFAGNIVDRFGQNKPFIVSFLIYGFGCFFIPIVPILALFFVMIFMGIADGILAPLEKSLITQNTIKNNRGFFVSTNISMQGLGKTISPVFLGLLVTNFGLPIAFRLLTVISIVPILIYFLLKLKLKD